MSAQESPAESPAAESVIQGAMFVLENQMEYRRYCCARKTSDYIQLTYNSSFVRAPCLGEQSERIFLEQTRLLLFSASERTMCRWAAWPFDYKSSLAQILYEALGRCKAVHVEHKRAIWRRHLTRHCLACEESPSVQPIAHPLPRCRACGADFSGGELERSSRNEMERTTDNQRGYIIRRIFVDRGNSVERSRSVRRPAPRAPHVGAVPGTRDACPRGSQAPR